MGKAASKITQALGFGPKTGPGGTALAAEPKPVPWDTTMDQLFPETPPGAGGIEPDLDLDIPMRPKRRRRPPQPPPSMYSRGRRRPLPSSPLARRGHRRGGVHAMRTPVISDMPRRVATRGVHATNAPTAAQRRARRASGSITEREIPIRRLVTNELKRRPSVRRRRPSLQRSQRLQELLQCPVCLNPYSEPRLLPCGHTYCDQCLNRLIQNDNDVVTCPECRKQHVVPDDGVFPPNFVVRNLLEEQGVHDRDGFPQRAKISTGRVIRFFVAVRKITRSHSQVKRLTIEMPIGNYIRDTCEALIRRIADREQLQSIEHQLVLEFGDKRLRQQRTLASYGVQNGDLLFLFNPEQRLSFLAYGDDDDNDGGSPLPSQPPLGVRVGARPRSNSYNSSASDIRTATSVDMGYNRTQQALRTISGRGDSDGSLNSDD